jgi:hypothetical protein
MVRQTARAEGESVRRAISALLLSQALLFWQTAPGGQLPYQSDDQHLGVASCASSTCHGSVAPNAVSRVPLNEFVTWSHRDSHARSFDALLGERGSAIATNLGLPSARSSKICLDCHADNVAPAQRGPRFALTDGVGCEACHGGAQRWIASHTRNSNYRQDIAQGMYPTADLSARAALCESCHVGNAEKLATHRIMGAGHPRLSFELDTYLALEPPHYTVDARYRERKPTFSHAQLWAQGQLRASELQLASLQRASSGEAGVFPELALFNCSACHDSRMRRPEWRRRSMTQLTIPGTVPLNDAYWRMSWLIVRAINEQQGAQVLALGQAVQQAAMISQAQIAIQAHSLQDVLAAADERLATTPWSPTQTSKVLQDILQTAVDGEYRDYLGAEQALMAVDLLLIELGESARLKSNLDELYGLVKEDENYRAADFVKAMRRLRQALERRDPGDSQNIPQQAQ